MGKALCFSQEVQEAYFACFAGTQLGCITNPTQKEVVA
jgi:hypothetical protein